MNPGLKKSVISAFAIAIAGALFALGAFAAPDAFAADENPGGSCGKNLEWRLDTETHTLTISGTGPMTDYDPYAPWHGKTITRIIIEEGITTIDDYAFSYCDGITSIEIPSSVKSIGFAAFSYCENLASVKIPDSVRSISTCAFSDCRSLTSVKIPASVTNIGIGVFASCDSLVSITVDPKNKAYLNDEYGVLFNKNKTELIQYPAGNTRTSYKIPSGVKVITGWAFDDCNNLTSIEIPDSVTSISDQTFNYCNGLTGITVGSKNTIYSNDEYGVLFNKNKTKLIQYPAGNTRTSYSIPSGVKTIGDYAFIYCDSLASIEISDSVTSIGDWAFAYCYDLTSIEIPDSVTALENSAFIGCVDLTNVSFGKNSKLEIIDFRTFYDCVALKSITIPDSVTSIGFDAFRNCESLTSIKIPDSITSIDEYAFSSCTNLANAYYPGTPEEWKNVTVGPGNSALTKNLIYECNSGRPYYSGSCGKNLSWKLYTDGELKISGTGAMTAWPSSSSVPWYSYRSEIKSVTVTDGITSIDNSSLGICTGLKSITIPDSVTSISDDALIGLTDIYYAGSKAQWIRIANGASFDGTTVHYTLTSSDGLLSVIYTDEDFPEDADTLYLKYEEVESISSKFYQNSIYNKYDYLPIRTFNIIIVNGDGKAVQPADGQTIILRIKSNDVFNEFIKDGFDLSSGGLYDAEAGKIDFRNDLFTVEIDGRTVTEEANPSFLEAFSIIHVYSDANNLSQVETFKHDSIIIENGYIVIEAKHFSEYNICTYASFSEGDTGDVFDKPDENIAEIKVISAPKVTKYAYKSDKLELEGIELLVIYSDGTTKTVTDYNAMTAHGFSATTVGTKTVCVEYRGHTADFEITVEYTWIQQFIRIFLLGFLWY